MQVSTKRRWITVAVAFATLAVASPVAAAQPVTGDLSAKDSHFIEFVETHPGEFAAQDQLAQKLFGSRLYVQFEGMEREVTGAKASAMVDSAGTMASTMGDLPYDIFTNYISRSQISAGMWVGGSTTFRSDWAGQADPYDVGSLQFSAPSCITLNSHAIATSPHTNLGFLSDANVGAKSPIWKVHDFMNGFVMQAKNITASVILKKVGCSGVQSISSAWRYEANQSGSLSSISAAFGFLSVSYSGSTLSVQKSSSVMNFTY